MDGSLDFWRGVEQAELVVCPQDHTDVVLCVQVVGNGLGKRAPHVFAFVVNKSVISAFCLSSGSDEISYPIVT